MNKPKNFIRNYQSADYEQIISVFDDAYADIDTNYAPFEVMEKLRLHYPAGQIVACENGEIVGCILSLFCPFDEFSQPKAMADIYDPDNFGAFNDTADSLFALEILVKSNQQRKGIGKLLNQAISNVLKDNNLRAFIGVSRLSGYAAVQSQMSVETYMQKVQNRELFDPALSYNCANQMLPTQAIHDYYPADAASAGFGALVIQHNPFYTKIS